jgi:hypothetical protein
MARDGTQGNLSVAYPTVGTLGWQSGRVLPATKPPSQVAGHQEYTGGGRDDRGSRNDRGAGNHAATRDSPNAPPRGVPDPATASLQPRSPTSQADAPWSGPGGVENCCGPAWNGEVTPTARTRVRAPRVAASTPATVARSQPS